jgi:hypothetical protein
MSHSNILSNHGKEQISTHFLDTLTSKTTTDANSSHLYKTERILSGHSHWKIKDDLYFWEGVGETSWRYADLEGAPAFLSLQSRKNYEVCNNA